MKIKIFALTILAVAVMLMPTAVALADTTIYEGTVNYTNAEPVQIVYKACSAGTYDAGTKAWTVSAIGAQSVTLTMTAQNNGTTGYTVLSAVSPATSSDGTITASWNVASKYIAAGASYDFVLTVTSTTATIPQSGTFTTRFSR